jgi:PAS domain S-box-containing protein
VKIQDFLKSDLLTVVTGLYENPHIVVDIKGNIFFSNPPARELLGLSSSDNNIFDLFAGTTSELFYSIIKGNYKDKVQPVVIQFSLKNGESRTVQMRYSHIEADDHKYLSFTFSSEKLYFKQQPEINIAAETEVTHYTELLDLIKRNFPFTIMGKDIVRKKIDEIKEFFWIKDKTGKFLLVNKAFAEYLGLHSSNIEGTNEEEYIPGFLKSVMKSMEEYILNSGKGIKISGIMFGSAPFSRERLELPLLSSESRVYAIAGMTISQNGNAAEELDLIEHIPRPAALIDQSGIIIKYSEEFRLIFNIDKKIRNIHFEKLFSSDLSGIINVFIKSGLKEEIRSITGDANLKKVYYSGYSVFLKKVRRQKENQVLIFIDELKSNQDMQEVSNLKGKINDILIQNNPEPVFLYEKENLRFLEVNQTALNLYGYSKSEFLQMDLTDLYAPEDIQTLLGALNQNITEGIFTGPFRQKKKDGTFIHVEVSKFNLKYNNKDAHYSILRDVTRKIDAEKETRLFKSAFENTEQLIFITDSSGFIRSFNNAVITSLGYKKADLEKSSFTALVKDDDRGNINTGIFRSQKKETKKISAELKHCSGELKKYDLTATPVFDYKNEVDAYTILCADRQSGKIKEVTKEIIIERIMPADNQMHGDNAVLLSSVFHEILTPINVILGFVQELTDSIDVLTPEQKEASDIINQNRMSLLNTMNSVAEYYNVEKKSSDLTMTRISAREIFDNLQNDFKELNRNRGLEIGYGKVVSSFYFDTDRSKFSNLIFLLIKTAGYLSKEKRIYVSLYPVDNDNFVITFKNKTDKISPGYMEDLIRMFSQWGTNGESGMPKLSLRLASRLLNQFNGEIYIKEDNSEVGFMFPVNPSKFSYKPKTVPPIEETYRPSTSSIKKPSLSPAFSSAKKIPVKETSLNLSQYSALYIEDQIDSQILFKVQMKELENIQFASSFEEALPLLDSQRFDFIVMDINLEGEYNGLDALRIIQKMPEYQNIPVIAVTAYLMPGDREKFISAGFNDFVPKPIFRDKMIEAMERVFKRR